MERLERLDQKLFAELQAAQKRTQDLIKAAAGILLGHKTD